MKNDRNKRSDSIEKTEINYDKTLDSLLEGCQIIGFDWRYLYLNDVTVKHGHRRKEELLGNTMMEMYPGIENTDMFAKLKSCMEKRITYRIENEFTYPDGTKTWFELRIEPVPDGIFILSIDIGERKKAEEELEKSFKSLKKNFRYVIDAMAKIVEMRDPYTAGHQHRVADLATAMAKEMNLEDQQVEQINMAAIIHDIGKIYVPPIILSKPGKLTDIELRLVRTHASSGYDIIKNFDFPSSFAKSILQHHERMDGSGYPQGLKAKDICVEAKILAIADVVEAMASPRPYRPALGINKALEEIELHKNVKYDPAIVDICLRLFREKKFKF